jgi:Kef-type K+ transport system membrane component KefB
MKSILAPGLLLLATLLTGCFGDNNNNSEASGPNAVDDVASVAEAGTALIARGEFSIVIAGLAVAAGRGSSIGALAATYVLISAIVGPLLMRYAVDLTRLVAFVRRRQTRGGPETLQ